MARSPGGFLVLVLVLTISIHQVVSILDFHKPVVLELSSLAIESSGSLEESYDALRTFQILGIEKKPDISVTTCKLVLKTLWSSSSSLKDLFYALKVNGILKCEIEEEVFEGIKSRLQSISNYACSLLDFYYSIGSLKLIKEQSSQVDVLLTISDRIFQSIKVLSQSDGSCCYDTNNPESSTYAAGVAFESLAGAVSFASSEIDQSRVLSQNDGWWSYGSNNLKPSTYAAGVALEELAGVVSLASSYIDKSMIDMLQNDLLKLLLKIFDKIEKSDDGAFYFHDKIDDGEHHEPLTTIASVIRGMRAVADAASVEIPGDIIVCLAKFFLSSDITSDTKDFHDLTDITSDTKDFDNLADITSFFESKRFAIPLILSVPARVLSLTKKDQLKVRVNTVLGSNGPPLTVKLLQAFSSGSKNAVIIENRELKFDYDHAFHFLDIQSENIDVGEYVFVFEILFHHQKDEKIYATGGQTRVPIFVTGVIKIYMAVITIFDCNLARLEIQRLDLAGDNAVSLSANYLQKLHFCFQLATPLGHAFEPQQVFLKLKHESKVEHLFVVGGSGKEFAIVLDFLKLVEKLFYLSGRYEIELTIGDTFMENFFLRVLGHVELDLPEPPKDAPRPPPPPVDPYLRYRPKPEIAYVFRDPEKQPPELLPLAFLGLTILSFILFLVGLFGLGVNLKKFPRSVVPATFAILFHLGLGAIMLLYVLFWWKLDLFTTLKILCILVVFLLFVGYKHYTYLASASAKVESASRKKRRSASRKQRR